MGDFDKTAIQLTESLTPFAEAQVNEFNAALNNVQHHTHAMSRWMGLGGLGLILATLAIAFVQIRSHHPTDPARLSGADHRRE